MRINNTVIGNPRESFHELSHDTTEQVVMDLRSSLDLFDYQLFGCSIFNALLHDSQSTFELTLGRAFSLARTTFITVPFVGALEDAVSLFTRQNVKTIDSNCFDGRVTPAPTDLRAGASNVEIDATKRLLGILFCAADAANVEIRARLLQHIEVGPWSNQKSVLVEVTLLATRRAVGGLFKFHEPEGLGPHPSPLQEEMQQSVALNNYHLEYKRVEGVETLAIVRKDGLTRLIWRSPSRARSSTVLPLEQGRGVSLYSLLAMRPLVSQRQALTQMFLRDADTIIAVSRNLGGKAEPWAVYLYRNTLFYVSPFARNEVGVPMGGASSWDQFKNDIHDDSKTTSQMRRELELAVGMGIAADLAQLQGNRCVVVLLCFAVYYFNLTMHYSE
jgi:hypothetical protein